MHITSTFDFNRKAVSFFAHYVEAHKLIRDDPESSRQFPDGIVILGVTK